jgi:hypothetical protein
MPMLQLIMIIFVFSLVTTLRLISSLLLLLVVVLLKLLRMARWVAWATEHHINHYAFRNETEFDEKLEHDSRIDMPLFLLKNYAWKDLMGALFGRKLDEPSFLIKRSKEEAAKLQLEQVEEEEAAEESDYDQAAIALARDQVEKEVLSKRHTLPVQKPSVQRHITLDIRMDRRNSKMVLNQDGDDNNAEMTPEKEDIIRRITTNKDEEEEKPSLQRRFTTAVALGRYATMNRALASKVQPVKSSATTTAEKEDDTTAKLQRQVTMGRENLGGNAAWEALRSTNNPESYKAATVAAKDRFIQRRATAYLRKQASGVLKKHDVRTLPNNSNRKDDASENDK